MTYGNGFLPAVYSATELSLSGVPIQYLDRPQSIGGDDQRRVLDFSQRLNRHSSPNRTTTTRSPRASRLMNWPTACSPLRPKPWT